MHHPTDRIAHTTAFVMPVVEHWLEREIAQWVHPMKDRSDDPPHHEQTLLPRNYISLLRFDSGFSLCLYTLSVSDSGLSLCLYTLSISDSGLSLCLYTLSVSDSGLSLCLYTLSVSDSGLSLCLYTLSVSDSGLSLCLYTVTVSDSGLSLCLYTLSVSFSCSSVLSFSMSSVTGSDDWASVSSLATSFLISVSRSLNCCFQRSSSSSITETWNNDDTRTAITTRKEMFYLTTHSTYIYLRLYGVRHMVKDHSDSKRGRKEMFYLTTHSTHFIYGYMASDIW